MGIEPDAVRFDDCSPDTWRNDASTRQVFTKSGNHQVFCTYFMPSQLPEVVSADVSFRIVEYPVANILQPYDSRS
jgi:hypothetical protein